LAKRRYTMVSAREIVGKKIVSFEARRQDMGRVGYKQMVHDPRIVLDDGSVLVFIAEEAEVGSGVMILRVKPEKK
jgi:hypothetical protein